MSARRDQQSSRREDADHATKWLGRSRVIECGLGRLRPRVRVQRGASARGRPRLIRRRAHEARLGATGAPFATRRRREAGAELERTVLQLTAENERLRERIRELEIGFRRFISERTPPEQLKLVLEKNALAPNDGAEASPATEAKAPEATVDPAPAPAPTAPAPPPESANPPPSDPKAERQKNRHNHGRRRETTLPKVIVEIVPPEVERLGLANFERIGYEESSTLGYRRGGCIEVVTRRGKYVPIGPSSKETSPATPNDAPAVTPSLDTTAPVTSAPPAPAAPSPGDPVVVALHEVATVLADPTCKHNPFVDGAIVYYTPKLPVADAALAPVLIAPVPERPIHGSLVDASLLAHLFVHKFDYHTPFFRQEIEARRQGCPNSRTNMERCPRALVDRHGRHRYGHPGEGEAPTRPHLRPRGSGRERALPLLRQVRPRHHA